MNQPEHELQKAAFRYFRLRFPHLRLNYFSVPNGSFRNLSTARKLKAEGTLAGVADTILMVPNAEYHGLAIEFKIKPRKPSPEQIEWLDNIAKHGYKTAICYTFDEFKQTIEEYLKPI